MKRRVPGLTMPVLFLIAAVLAAPIGAAAGSVRQVTDVKTTVAGPGAMDDAGTELQDGWLLVRDGIVEALGGGPYGGSRLFRPEPDPCHSLPRG